MGDAALDALQSAVDSLMEEGVQRYADAESMERLHRELSRIEALVTDAAAAFDASGAWAPDGARDAAAWLATRCHLPRTVARRRVALGRRMRDLPASSSAWNDGTVTEHHVRAIAGVRRPSTESALQRDEEMLVGHARTLRFEQFTKVLAYWEQMADPDGAELSDAERRAGRECYLVETFRGTWIGRLRLDPISGAIVGDELARLEKGLFEEEWAETKERLGRDPKVHELERTPAQRRADALVEMATRSKACQPDVRRPLPLFTVLVGYESLHGRILELANGTVVTPGSLVPWLTQAMIERAVFSPRGRVEIGETARLFSGATRRAIALRDRICSHPYCDRPVDRCQVDHIVPFSQGGLTTQENGRLLCGFHNRLRNQRPPPAA